MKKNLPPFTGAQSPAKTASAVASKSMPAQLSPNPTPGKQKPKGPLTPEMKKRKDPPALGKLEEKYHRDFDGDGEKGEGKAHAKKVLSKKPLPFSSTDKAKIKKK